MEELELRRYAVILWRWLWLIALGAVLAGGTAYVTSRQQTPVYSASTLLMISPSKAQIMDTLSVQPMADRLAATYTQMLVRRPVLDAVIGNLALPTTAQILGRSVSAQQLRNTQLLQLSVEDTDPVRAAVVANEIPRVFIEQNSELQTRRYADLRASLQRQMDETQANALELQGRIDEMEASAAPDQTVLDRYRRNMQSLQSSYASLSKSFEDLRLEEAKQLDTLVIAEAAMTPTVPIRPKTMQNTLLATIVGAMLALGVAFLAEYLDDVLKNPDDVEKSLGLTTLGAVPAMPGDSAETPAMLEGGHTAITEAYRVLRTNLQFAAVDRPLRTLQISSASPSEGKSVTSVNLAVALAQAGKQVILVDCDLHRPRSHRLLKLSNNVGLTSTLLSPGSDPLTVLNETAVPGLRVITSGPLPPNPAELLGSARMRDVLAALCEAADTVILDSPPVLAMSDSAILASQVDGVLLVLSAKDTRRELARRALASLEQVHARVIGVVLNRVSRERSGYYYYYYSHYDEPSNGSRPHRRRRTKELGAH